MKANFRIINPKQVEFEMRILMPLEEWEALSNQLSEGFPAWTVSRSIREMVEYAKTHFRPKVED